MRRVGMVAVFYHPDVETATRIVTACAQGGAAVVEFTNRGDGAAWVFAEIEAYCRKELPELILGVGSIVDAPTAALYIGVGANFVVGPVLDEETAYLCNARKIPYCPGCGSATEIHRAHRLGVEICKIFPGGEVGGPSFARAVRGPMPYAEIMPTGGVEPTEASLSAWFDSGVVCVGMGSALITEELVSRGDFAGLAKKIRETVGMIRKIRENKDTDKAMK
jgi:2-dehydro-3-deoxyphosphogluconate aldolase/(4S)-4-hydroxy-2-oxoglutarate aldolase